MRRDENHWGNMRELRFAAESLTDAIDLRVKIQNRIRSGSADLITAGMDLTEAEVKKHPLVARAIEDEDSYRQLLTSRYEQAVPLKVREWAQSQPIIRSGELFPRLVGLTGNPRWAVPLKLEGTGKDRKAVPDGEPYERACRCNCGGCREARATHFSDQHCHKAGNRCRGLRSFWQYCGCGDPDLVPEAGNQAVLLRRGKVKTVRPILFTFTKQLVMSAARSDFTRESDLYKVYQNAKAGAADKRHTKTCRNKHRPPMSPNGCGIVAHPEWGEVGSPWRPGHQQAHAYRVTQKELLRGFWQASEGTTWDEVS
jgi:hypothetical protein